MNTPPSIATSAMLASSFQGKVVEPFGLVILFCIDIVANRFLLDI